MRQVTVTAQGRDHVNRNMIQNTVRIYQFLKDQRPVRSHVHLLGNRPVLFQLTQIVYYRSRTDNCSPSAESLKFGFMAHSRGTAQICRILIFDY